MDTTSFLASQALSQSIEGNATPRQVDEFYNDHALQWRVTMIGWITRVRRDWRWHRITRRRPDHFAPVGHRG